MCPKVTNDSEADDATGGESEHTNFSHERDSTDEDANEVDTEDSSDCDYIQLEKRNREFDQDLRSLEEQFNTTREQYYQVRTKLIEKQLAEVRNETSKDYITKAKEHDEVYQRRINIADALYQLSMQNINHQDAAEQLSANQQFKEDTENFREMLKEHVEDKIRALEEERHNIDISMDEWANCKRGNKVRGPGRKKPAIVNGPYIVYMIEEEKILQDLAIIRRALKRMETSVNDK